MYLQGMSSVFFNKGENCIAAGRLFVAESIHDEYVERIVSLYVTCGYPLPELNYPCNV